MGGAPLLSPDLDDAAVSAGRGDHRPPFGDARGQRLFDVNVLPRLAGVDGRQRVPVVGCADDDGLDVLAVEDPPEVPIALRRRARISLTVCAVSSTRWASTSARATQSTFGNCRKAPRSAVPWFPQPTRATPILSLAEAFLSCAPTIPSSPASAAAVPAAAFVEVPRKSLRVKAFMPAPFPFIGVRHIIL